MTGPAIVYAPVDGTSAEWMDERLVVLDATGERISTLSPTGSLLWDELPADAGRLVDRLQDQHPDVDPDVLRADVARFVDDLVAAGLVRPVDASD